MSSEEEHSGFSGSEAQGKPELFRLLTRGNEGMGVGQDEAGTMSAYIPCILWPPYKCLTARKMTG